MSDQGSSEDGGRWLFAAIAGALAMGALFLGARFLPRAEPPAAMEVAAGRELGGPFTLTDHTGASFSSESLLGRPSLIFFGFTYCPDICPLSLQRMAVALQMIGPDADAFQNVFISVDPERDTPEQLALYIDNDVFPEGLVGLTGSPEDIARVAKQYGVYYAKNETPESAADYLIDHTSIIYLMDENGRLAEPFSHDDTPARIAEGLRAHLEQRRAAQG